MKASHFAGALLIFLPSTYIAFQGFAAEPFELKLERAGPKNQLSWPTAINDPQGNLKFPEYEVQSSTDFMHWQPLPGKVRGLAERSGPRLTLTLDAPPNQIFYRVKADLNSEAAQMTGDGGAEVFGYGSLFEQELTRLSSLSIADFATNGATIPYLEHLTFDPRTAQFWTNAALWLSPKEVAVLTTNGFVVSQRWSYSSFGDAYYGVFMYDLPVFVTSDSVLHAWHRSYQSMLKQFEENDLSPWLEQMLAKMSAQLPSTWQQYGQGTLGNSILDADYFLTVARSLCAGTQLESALGRSEINQQVSNTLTAIAQANSVQTVQIFGSGRMIDFSQFKVRGHYDSSELLRRYFRTMMWCGRTDLRLATFPPNKEGDLRQLGTAIIMDHLMTQSAQFPTWSRIERTIRAFVGPTDSMTFAQIRGLLAQSGIQSPADVTGPAKLIELQTRLLTGELGAQAIGSDAFWVPFDGSALKLPRSFTICGQKFALDSWAMSQVVFDRVPVWRRKSSDLDVAFSVFGNDQVVPEITSRMQAVNGVPYRDGFSYQANLLAVRNVIQGQAPQAWTDNIYNAWLGALRTLSGPTTDPKYPEAMRTRPWAMKTVNTQLASWTELRHDTVLYVKQPYVDPILCGYPDGFVEPRPEFWKSMEQLALVTAEVLSGLGPSSAADNQLAFLNSFASCMRTLESIAAKELAQQPLSASETEFLKNVAELHFEYMGVRQWNGWYPRLFYGDPLDCAFADRLVVDVLTDLPDEVSGDPGAVLHEAVGDVHTLVIAVDNGPDRMVYVGPVFSHYEFEKPAVVRMTDSEWASSLWAPPPDWTRSFLVPKY